MRGYDSQLDKLDAKNSVISNGLEKCMAFLLNKNLLCTGSMQFMNFSLDKLVKNLANIDFKYLVKEFGSENLELLNQKDAYPYEYMNSFEKFHQEKLPAKKMFL